jgi:hypothetical protein
MILELGHFGNQIRKVLKCGAREGWRKSHLAYELSSTTLYLKKDRRKDRGKENMGKKTSSYWLKEHPINNKEKVG